jgi:hypothetical protein
VEDQNQARSAARAYGLDYDLCAALGCPARTLNPVRVVVAAMVCTMTSWLVSGRPRQFIVMWENSRCSIWGEIQLGRGTRQLARAKHWPVGQDELAKRRISEALRQD